MTVTYTYHGHTSEYWLALEAEAKKLREDNEKLRKLLKPLYSDSFIEAELSS